MNTAKFISAGFRKFAVRSVVAAGALGLSLAPGHAQVARPTQPTSAPPEELVVTGKAISDFVRARNFVREYTAPSAFLDQIARWQSPVCVKTQGLAKGYNAFVTARLKEVATQIGAPGVASEACEANLNIIFTIDPQAYVDDIKRRTPQLLGVHYPALFQKIAAVTHPVQAWYATGTRGERGTYHLDAYDGFSMPIFMVPGSHLDSGLSSGFAAVTIVADINKIAGWEIGTIADYIAMAAFSRAKTLGRCQGMPSVSNALENCADAVKAKALSDYDMAYLKALYSTRDNQARALQEYEIGWTMLKILKQQVAEKQAVKGGVAR